MSDATSIWLMAIVVTFNFAAMAIVSAVVLKRTKDAKEASKRCAEENRKEREASAAEFKNLAEKVTSALKNIANVLHKMNEKIESSTITRRMPIIEEIE